MPHDINLQTAAADHVIDLTTKSGFQFQVRVAHPDDEAILAALFANVTPRDLRFRFLSAVRVVSHNQIVKLVADSDRKSISFLACCPRDGTVIATGMLVMEADGTSAEVALAVRADMKQHGISWSLLRHILAHAKACGVKAVESIESADHIAAIALETEMGFESHAYDNDATLRTVRYNLEQLGAA